MSYRTAPIVPPDVITYRLGSKYVYVAPAPSYEEALSVALKEFPEELVPSIRDRIVFMVFVKTTRGDERTVRISESAWAPTVARLMRGDIVDIQVQAQLPGADNDDEPPRYLEVSGSERKSRLPSPTPSRKLKLGMFCRSKDL